MFVNFQEGFFFSLISPKLYRFCTQPLHALNLLNMTYLLIWLHMFGKKSLGSGGWCCGSEQAPFINLKFIHSTVHYREVCVLLCLKITYHLNICFLFCTPLKHCFLFNISVTQRKRWSVQRQKQWQVETGCCSVSQVHHQDEIIPQRVCRRCRERYFTSGI